MTLPFLGLLAVLTSQSQSQVRLVVESGGRQLGYANMSQKLNADGTKSVELRMELEADRQTLTMRSQNSYDASGSPIRKFLDSNLPGGKLQRQVIATFDKAGAKVVIIDGGKRTTRQIALVETAPRVNATEFWFIKTVPKVGDSVKCYVFNINDLEWQLQTTYYRGKKNLRQHGQEVMAHYVETVGSRASVAFLDDQGLPYLVESGTTTMRRAKI